MKETNMDKALDKAVEDVAALVNERREQIKRDMADSFVAQSEEDPDKKLSWSLTVGVKIAPTCDGAEVDTAIKWKVAKKATASSVVGE